jgi:hypothetical protein
MPKPSSSAATPPADVKGLGYLAAQLAAPVSSAEAALRPLSFADFAGQPKTVERLKIMVGAARTRGEALNHILLSGPPGLGKTTLSLILGAEMGRNVRITSGPVVEKASDLAGLAELDRGRSRGRRRGRWGCAHCALRAARCWRGGSARRRRTSPQALAVAASRPRQLTRAALVRFTG